MIKAHAVIGANFGDEGKGLTTDYLASKTHSLVIRYNGGAQAGHTVLSPDGKRHVFGHFGAGTFVGADTYLSCYFIVNPIFFLREYDKLKPLARPRVFIDSNCAVSTPYDVMINQFIEARRGSKRHGSCGAGINETVTRDSSFPFRMTNLSQPDLKAILLSIRQKYVPTRLEALGMANLTEEENAILFSDTILDQYIEDCQELLALTHTVYGGIKTLKNRSLGLRYEQYLFEGAQGLRLDEKHRNYPHVTRSRTGMQNIITLASEAGVSKLDVHYITRAYLTRHGAGPLDRELHEKPYTGIEDATNIPNPFQGTLRFAHLDIDDLASEISEDFMINPFGVKTTKNIVVSCIDQLPEGCATYYLNRQKRATDFNTFLGHVKTKTHAANLMFSVGPTRDYMQSF